MNPWLAKATVIAAAVVMVVIRAPHGSRSYKHKVARSWKDRRETAVLTLAWIGFVIPLVWALSPALSFADYPLRPGPYFVGLVCFVLGLWLFYRSHLDLGTNWSVTLEIRENHRLVTNGVYRFVRHPMYSALLLYAFGQALVVPNWVAGPSYIVAMAILVPFRLGTEERMMRETFGTEYESYMATTKRFIPGVW